VVPSSSSSDDASSEASSDSDSDDDTGARLTGYDELAGGGLMQMPTLLEVPTTEPQDTLLDLEVRVITIFELDSKDCVHIQTWGVKAGGLCFRTF
jgi:hypothetical protein